MVEVFKTNVETRESAEALLEQIQILIPDCKANFDLEDCDKILRVESHTNTIDNSILIDLLYSFGFDIEVLPDDIQPVKDSTLHLEIQAMTSN